MELGKRIKELRTQRRMSQETLAAALNISRQAVAKWEAGASMPSTANLLALCEVFQIELTELLSTEQGIEKEEIRMSPEAERKKVRRGRKILPWLLLALGLALLLLAYLAARGPWSNPGMSVGVIGGADGPTAIFVTSDWRAVYQLFVLLAGICLGVAVGIFIHRTWKGWRDEK